MPEMTPIRVRGKRNVAAAKERHAGKKRKIAHDASPSPSNHSSTASSQRTRRPKSRKRKLGDTSLSWVEQLPTEILQHIFAYHPNPNLAAASPRLLAQLASRHVYMSVTSRVIGRILGFKEDERASSDDLAAATRLLGSRFMSYEFFSSWLREQSDEPAVTTPEDAGHRDGHFPIWVGLRPSRGLLPPKKLLVGPWTAEKNKFLWMLRIGMPDITASDPIYGEIAAEGLAQAVAERQPDVVMTMMAMGMRSSTDLLRQAVIDYGCERDIVGLLFRQCTRHFNLDWRQAEASSGGVVRRGSIPVDIDFFDSALWAWADKARARGDPAGQWLMDLLRRGGEVSGGQPRWSRSPKLGVAHGESSIA